MEKFDVLSFYGNENEELQKEYERMFCNMTQEEKRLLFKDLSARLPYGVKFPYHKEEDSNYRECNCVATLYSINEDSVEFDYSDNGLEREWSCTLSEVKPYLRPMSSMTEEEETLFRCELPAIAKTDAQLVAMRMELFLKGHLDFNHLIEKGLALEAPEGMYKID